MDIDKDIDTAIYMDVDMPICRCRYRCRDRDWDMVYEIHILIKEGSDYLLPNIIYKNNQVIASSYTNNNGF